MGQVSCIVVASKPLGATTHRIQTPVPGLASVPGLAAALFVTPLVELLLVLAGPT
jgi:hypothetical protein